jgi:sulfur carrier protein
MITVHLNELDRRLPAGCTVAQLLVELAAPARGVAVAVNGEVVRRAQWPEQRLRDGDRVDVLTATQGG